MGLPRPLRVHTRGDMVRMLDWSMCCTALRERVLDGSCCWMYMGCSLVLEWGWSSCMLPLPLLLM
jgi:hypothetical protein